MRRVGVVVAEEDVVPPIDEVETAAPKALESDTESFRLHRRRVKKTLVEGMGALATAIVEKQKSNSAEVAKTFQEEQRPRSLNAAAGVARARRSPDEGTVRRFSKRLQEQQPEASIQRGL